MDAWAAAEGARGACPPSRRLANAHASMKYTYFLKKTIVCKYFAYFFVKTARIYSLE